MIIGRIFAVICSFFCISHLSYSNDNEKYRKSVFSDNRETQLDAHPKQNIHEQSENKIITKHDGETDFEKAFLLSSDGKKNSNTDKEIDKTLKKAASEGDPEAEGALALSIFGKHTKQAISLWKDSARQGNDKSEFYLGLLYESGVGVSHSPREAFYWWEKSAQQGNPDAELWLGRQYMGGDGAPKDSEKAASLFQKSTSKGNSDAEGCLGLLYLVGDGVPKDSEKAISLFQKAASKGNSDAALSLSRIYLVGSGKTPQDMFAAKYWLEKSASQGNEEARVLMSKLQ